MGGSKINLRFNYSSIGRAMAPPPLIFQLDFPICFTCFLTKDVRIQNEKSK